MTENNSGDNDDDYVMKKEQTEPSWGFLCLQHACVAKLREACSSIGSRCCSMRCCCWCTPIQAGGLTRAPARTSAWGALPSEAAAGRRWAAPIRPAVRMSRTIMGLKPGHALWLLRRKKEPKPRRGLWTQVPHGASVRAGRGRRSAGSASRGQRRWTYREVKFLMCAWAGRGAGLWASSFRCPWLVPAGQMVLGLKPQTNRKNIGEC